jgi:mono/diheme cytochrome c family protein
VLPVVAGLSGLRLLRAGALGWTLGWWISFWVLFSYGFRVPVPHSVVTIYMTIVSAALAIYVSSSRERWQAFSQPIVQLAVDPRKRLLLAALVVALPVLTALNVYRTMSVPLEAPSFARTVHPAPPDTITVHEREIDLIHGDNPYRALEHDDPEAFRAHLENGRRVFFQNCFYCHGDRMAGDGMFAHGLNPIPTNFTDQGVLPMFQETFLFWRVSKGGPGLPEEGGPWDSAMPAWEKLLTEEEMWDVVSYLFEYTGYRPRARESHE